MTRQEFYYYLTEGYGLEQRPLSDFGRATCIEFKNPKTKTRAWLDTPIDDRPMKSAAICQICTLLGIEIPECAKHIEPLMDKIKNTHYPTKR